MARIGNKSLIASAYVLGVAAWLAVLAVGPGATPLDSGPAFLLALGIAGCAIALLRGEVRAIDLLALYAGQASALVGQALLSESYPSTPGVPLHLLFLVSFNLVAALGAALPSLAGAGAVVTSADEPEDEWLRRKE
jgi:hypothetical protein